MNHETHYDCSGWATRNDLLCSDGRVIRRDAFKHNDGKVVPVVWNHSHRDPFHVLGKALLKNMPEGVKAFISFNDTDQGKNAKMIVEHGDVPALSIFANNLRQNGSDVNYGDIKEVSLVLAGANPGAKIDFESFAHGENFDEEEAVIFTGESIELYHSEDFITHADKEKEDEDKEDKEEEKKEPEEKKDGDKDKDEKEEKDDDNDDVESIFKSMTPKQQAAALTVIGAAVNEYKKNNSKDDEKKQGGNSTMKHNVFDQTEMRTGNYLSHSDEQEILKLAKQTSIGSFRDALTIYTEQNQLQHDDEPSASDEPAVVTAVASGFVQPPTAGNISLLFPEYKEVRPGAPELLTNDQGWVTQVMNKVHKSPISRIRTSIVDIRNMDGAHNDLRARGYVKGNKKIQEGNFSLLRRTTDPQTVYVKNALHRDDIIDITDFDYVQYLYNIDRMNLIEELATAIMIGDGRADGAEDKIDPTHIRPIWTDDNLYTIHTDIDLTAARTEIQGTDTGDYFSDNYVYAEAMIQTLLYAMENYKGSGSPDMFITPHMLNVMLLSRDRNGRRIFDSKRELEAALNVRSIITAEQFANKTRTVTVNSVEKTKKLIALVVNLSDYHVGATKGGEITHFTQFDIDFNQQKSLLETRCSGALTKVYSAIAIEEDVTAGAGEG